MDFKRHHHQHPGFNFNSRLNNQGNGAHGGYHPGGFGNHHPHPQHSSRSFKPNEGHGMGGRLNLMHSFRNLMKMQGDMVMDRTSGFQKMSQLRDLMLSRITNIAGNLLKDEFVDDLVSEITGLIKEDKLTVHEGYEESSQNEALSASDNGKSSIQESKLIDGIKFRLRGRLRDALNGIAEETRIYAMREDNFLSTILFKERRVDKDLLEFFGEAERQILDYEKKIRNDQYGQLFNRFRNPEKEIALRDQKILQLEDTLKLYSERSEKCMTEMQQASSDHNFEKVQLYHHADLCRVNTKSIAVQLLVKICKWRRCSCGRDFEDVLHDFEANFVHAYNSSPQECYAIERVRHVEMPNCTSSWNFPTCQLPLTQTQMAPNQPIPTGSFLPSEDAATKGMVLNDLRDRYEELLLKATSMPNYDEVRAMITKIVCHFKEGGFRVCEEIRGNQFVSSLFYCESKELLPSKTNKIFSTGYGDTPEEATWHSVQRAMDEIRRIENIKVGTEAEGVEMTFIRRNPSNSVFGKLDNEAIRMTLLRSYCNEKVDDEKATEDVRCFQEAHLYQNHANAVDKYMADWKIHLRVEDSLESGLREKLKRVLRTIKDSHLTDFIDQKRPQKENTTDT